MSKQTSKKTETKRMSVSVSIDTYKKLMVKMIEETGSTNSSDYISSLIEKDLNNKGN